MRGWIKFATVTLGAGLIVGIGVCALMYEDRKHSDTSTEKPGVASENLNAISSSNTVSGSNGSGLSVTDNGNQGSVLGTSGSTQNSGQSGTSIGSSSGSGSSSSSSSQSSQLPTPSQFRVYDQYKNNATALYIDVQPGTGAAVGKGSVVTMNYRGWLTDGTEFDESYNRGTPYSFTEGNGTVIPGLAESMFGMKAGGTRRLIIPPGVGYGAAGKSPIPSDAVLIFDVELVSVK